MEPPTITLLPSTPPAQAHNTRNKRHSTTINAWDGGNTVEKVSGKWNKKKSSPTNLEEGKEISPIHPNVEQLIMELKPREGEIVAKAYYERVYASVVKIFGIQIENTPLVVVPKKGEVKDVAKEEEEVITEDYYEKLTSINLKYANHYAKLGQLLAQLQILRGEEKPLDKRSVEKYAVETEILPNESYIIRVFFENNRDKNSIKTYTRLTGNQYNSDDSLVTVKSKSTEAKNKSCQIVTELADKDFDLLKELNSRKLITDKYHVLVAFGRQCQKEFETLKKEGDKLVEDTSSIVAPKMANPNLFDLQTALVANTKLQKAQEARKSLLASREKCINQQENIKKKYDEIKCLQTEAYIDLNTVWTACVEGTEAAAYTAKTSAYFGVLVKTADSLPPQIMTWRLSKEEEAVLAKKAKEEAEKKAKEAKQEEKKVPELATA